MKAFLAILLIFAIELALSQNAIKSKPDQGKGIFPVLKRQREYLISSKRAKFAENVRKTEKKLRRFDSKTKKQKKIAKEGAEVLKNRLAKDGIWNKGKLDQKLLRNSIDSMLNEAGLGQLLSMSMDFEDKIGEECNNYMNLLTALGRSQLKNSQVRQMTDEECQSFDCTIAIMLGDVLDEPLGVINSAFELYMGDFVATCSPDEMPPELSCQDLAMVDTILKDPTVFIEESIGSLGLACDQNEDFSIDGMTCEDLDFVMNTLNNPIETLVPTLIGEIVHDMEQNCMEKDSFMGLPCQLIHIVSETMNYALEPIPNIDGIMNMVANEIIPECFEDMELILGISCSDVSQIKSILTNEELSVEQRLSTLQNQLVTTLNNCQSILGVPCPEMKEVITVLTENANVIIEGDLDEALQQIVPKVYMLCSASNLSEMECENVKDILEMVGYSFGWADLFVTLPPEEVFELFKTSVLENCDGSEESSDTCPFFLPIALRMENQSMTTENIMMNIVMEELENFECEGEMMGMKCTDLKMAASFVVKIPKMMNGESDMDEMINQFLANCTEDFMGMPCQDLEQMASTFMVDSFSPTSKLPTGECLTLMEDLAGADLILGNITAALGSGSRAEENPEGGQQNQGQQIAIDLVLILVSIILL